MIKNDQNRPSDAADVIEGASAMVALAEKIREGVAKVNEAKIVIPAKDLLRCADMLSAAARLIDALTTAVETGDATFGVMEPPQKKGII